MGTTWGREDESKFGESNPQAALNWFENNSTYNPDKVHLFEEYEKMAKIVARLTETELAVWINSKVPDKNPEAVMRYEAKAREYQSRCRKSLGMEEYKSTVN